MSINHAVVGDIGGTNFRLALSTPDGLKNIQETRYSEADTPESLIKAFVASCDEPKKIKHGVFAIASPSKDASRVIFTNGPWKQRPVPFKIDGMECSVLNDFAAITYAVTSLKEEDCRNIHGPEPFLPSRLLANKSELSKPTLILESDPAQRFVVVGPGTGLGVSCGHMTSSGQFQVMGGEGGHASFSPDSKEELAVKQYLQDEKDIEVTMETIASGTGLPMVFNAYAKTIGKTYEVATASDVSDMARTGTFNQKRCARWALDLFAKTLGRCASSAVLTTDARTLFIAGGMPRHLGSQFKQSTFLDAFHQNDLGANNITENVSVVLIKHPQAGLLGAHSYFRLSQG